MELCHEIATSEKVSPGEIFPIAILTREPGETIKAFQQRWYQSCGLIVGLPVSTPKPVHVAFPDQSARADHVCSGCGQRATRHCFACTICGSGGRMRCHHGR